MVSNHTGLVIPAKAGIYGLTERFEQRVLGIRLVPTMDSRLRGNDKVCGCGVG
jgi:hypothetical protein